MPLWAIWQYFTNTAGFNDLIYHLINAGFFRFVMMDYNYALFRLFAVPSLLPSGDCELLWMPEWSFLCGRHDPPRRHWGLCVCVFRRVHRCQVPGEHRRLQTKPLQAGTLCGRTQLFLLHLSYGDDRCGHTCRDTLTLNRKHTGFTYLTGNTQDRACTMWWQS